MHKIYGLINYALSASVAFSFFQIPYINNLETLQISPITISNVEVGEVLSDHEKMPITDVFFGLESKTPATESRIEKQIAFVSSRKAYPASLAVVEKHAKTIKSKAGEKHVPEDVALGVALLENGGSDTAVSKAGALGVFQLMPGTARNLGLTVNKKADERKNPEKNIEAGVTYLAQNYERFGDWGLATWAYHAGEGNVAKALKIYAKANNNIDLPSSPSKNWKALHDYVEKHGLTIHKLLSDPKVKAFTKKLNDDSAGYPYKVVATATLFREHQ
ncbi:MAG: transglycosylase SLT domain-containing protein [Patescibacteria group bacterium]